MRRRALGGRGCYPSCERQDFAVLGVLWGHPLGEEMMKHSLQLLLVYASAILP